MKACKGIWRYNLVPYDKNLKVGIAPLLEVLQPKSSFLNAAEWVMHAGTKNVLRLRRHQRPLSMGMLRKLVAMSGLR